MEPKEHQREQKVSGIVNREGGGSLLSYKSDLLLGNMQASQKSIRGVHCWQWQSPCWFLHSKSSMASTTFTPFFYFPKTFATEPLSLDSIDEKPRNICLTHHLLWERQMLQGVVLILKFLPIDGLVTSAIVICEVTTLAHESWNNSVQRRSPISTSFLCSAKSGKFFCCLATVCEQLKGGMTGCHVKELVDADHGCQQVAIGSVSVCNRANNVVVYNIIVQSIFSVVGNIFAI